MVKSVFYHVYINLTSGFSIVWLLTFFFPSMDSPETFFLTGSGIGIVFSAVYPQDSVPNFH